VLAQSAAHWGATYKVSMLPTEPDPGL